MLISTFLTYDHRPSKMGSCLTGSTRAREARGGASRQGHWRAGLAGVGRDTMSLKLVYLKGMFSPEKY